MKRTLLALAALAAVAAAPLAAQAAPWQTINQRQANLEHRIDQGVRNGSLTRSEALRLRGEFRSLSRLEASYRRSNGLSMRERADLDARFDRLSRQVRSERHDRQDSRHDRRRS
jgi:opacity protein-like surface antigen